MPDPTGFMRNKRVSPPRRPVPVRIMDWKEVAESWEADQTKAQAARCMDCGIPFCHDACPLGNKIPEWNDLARTGRWDQAAAQLHATNNFPEFTGRLCPAPCEAACVLGVGDDPVMIKQIEVDIVDRAFADGNVQAMASAKPSGKSAAVVGSGPAGLAAAQQLARAGHQVTVYERDDVPGGLLRYGIPDFKLDKRHVDRRLDQLRDEGVQFVCDCEVGVSVTLPQLRKRHDAVLLAVGAWQGRDVEVPGRDLAGVHLAMDHLTAANRVVAGRAPFPAVDAANKHVVIIGGGDTAADSLGVAHRQQAATVTQLDLYPRPPAERDPDRDPWPTWPAVLREYPAHAEGGERIFGSATAQLIGDAAGHVRAMRISEVTVDKSRGRREVREVPGTARQIPADLVLLAVGFAGVDDQPLLHQAGLQLRGGVVECGPDWQTQAEDVFVAGDAHRGASLIVWAIAEGRAAAAAIHRKLGGEGELPSPVEFDTQPLRA